MMKALCTLLTCILFPSHEWSQDRKPVFSADKLVGTWEAVKGTTPPGYLTEFSKDGKFTITVQVDGKDLIYEGSYTVRGDRLITTVKDLDGKNRTMSVRIVNLTHEKLVTDAGAEEASVFKRKNRGRKRLKEE